MKSIHSLFSCRFLVVFMLMGSMAFVIGSNTDGGVRNIYVNNCTFVSTDVGLRFKSSRGRGGLVENIYIRDIYMKDIMREAILFNTFYDTPEEDTSVVFEVNEKTPRFQKFHISNIYCNGASQATKIIGLPEMPVQDITFENITISAAKGFESREARHIDMTNVTIIPDHGPVYLLHNSRDFSFENITSPAETELFMKLDGKRTEHIRIIDTDLTTVKEAFSLGKEVNEQAVIKK